VVESIELDRLGHLVRVGARISDRSYRFLFDSGAGVSRVAPWVARAVGVPTGRTVTGRRMTGQELTAPVVALPLVSFGRFELTEPCAGVIDVDPDTDKPFDGLIGLDAFHSTVVTVDTHAGLFTFEEGSLDGEVLAPAEIRRTGLIVEMFVKVGLPSGRAVSALADTGAEPLVLNERFTGERHVEDNDPDFTVVAGEDETGLHGGRAPG
jgi:predicted aspartyl protease